MLLTLDKKLKLYSFPNHPFNATRYDVFVDAFEKRGLNEKVEIVKAREASKEELLLFHTKSYIDFVKEKSKTGTGYLDYGDTPAFKGCYEASCYVVGAVLNAIDAMLKEKQNAFVPIAGLHHAYPTKASGFCIFNDIGIAINYLRKKYSIEKILYFDIDAHHGDGVFYAFENDANVFIVDFHQMPLYPGTGYEWEKGKGKAEGTKLNLPLAPGSNDDAFKEKLKEVKKFLDCIKADFIIMQAGVDSMANDALANLNFKKVHSIATVFLLNYARKWKANILALGGGGYNLENIVKGWLNVIKKLN